jgi:hypothetical protein
MKKTIKLIIGLCTFCFIFVLNFSLINDNLGNSTYSFQINKCQAAPVDPGYLSCQSGTTTYIGEDGAVVAYWCGDCPCCSCNRKW